MVFETESITGVPTMPMLLRKSEYGLHQDEFISEGIGVRIPGCVKFFFQYNTPLVPSKA